MSALWQASFSGRTEEVQRLLEDGADIDEMHTGYTPLHIAAQNCHFATMLVLLDKGASADGPDGQPPLYWAALYGQLAVVQRLAEKGADVNAKQMIERNTPLHAACLFGHGAGAAIVQELIDKGARVNARTRFGCTPLHDASTSGSGEVVRLLLHNGARVDDKTNAGYTALHRAVDSARFLRGEVGRYSVVVQQLLDKGANVNSQSKRHYTPLHRACARGHLAMVKLLLDNDADITLTQDKGYMPLHSAAQRGNFDIVEVLLDKGAGLDARTILGETPAELATTHRQLHVTGLMREVARRRAARGAFAMGHHERLGAKSLVRGLHPEVVKMIMDQW
ncbi:ankyrin repeat-containing domain protein, partial [Baffinella frigidus]